MQNEVKLEQEGIVLNLQRFSLHDGPGIRTIVFLKGCPLSCKWCSNPESQSFTKQLMYMDKNCIGCKRCLDVCAVGAIDFNLPNRINHDKCTQCGKCVEVCYPQALNMAGTTMTVEEVLNELDKDVVHYRRSNGGITLSGGESLGQPEFAEQLLRGCKKKGWHTAIETSAQSTKETLNKIAPWVDLFLLDIKHMDPNKHMQYIGKSNERILENAKLISQSGSKVIIRIAIIPGFNDTIEEIQAITDFAKELRTVREIHILPYHRLGEGKYEYLGIKYEMAGKESPSKETMNSLKKVIEESGLICKIDGIS